MPRDIRTRFVLDGEAKYASAMKSISTEMRLLDAELGKATVGFDKNADAMKILSATSLNLEKKMDVQKQKIEAVAKELADAEKAYGENSEQAKKYAIELANAEIKLGKMKNELVANDKKMEELENSTDKAGDEMKQFGKHVGGAGDEADKSGGKFDGLGSVLKGGLQAGAAAAGAAIAAIAVATVAATKAVIELATESANWADEIMTTSTATGISTQTLQEWDYAARFIDTDTETMTKGLNKIVKATGAAAKAGEDHIAVTDSLSVSIRDANGGFKDSEQIFYDTVDALGQITDETEREIAAQELFGKSYQDMMPLVKAGSDGIRAYADEAAKSGVILDDGMISKLGDYDDTLQRVDAQQDALKKSFVINFIPALESGANALTGVMSDASAALSDGFQPEDIKTIGSSITGVLSEMMKGLGTILPEVADVVTTLITTAVDIIGDLLPVILPVLIDSAFVLLQSLMDAIGENVQPIADMVTQLVLALVDFFIENLPMVIELALQVIIALASGLAEALPDLIPAIIDMVIKIVDVVMENIGLIIDAGIQILLGVVNGLVAALPQLIAYIPELITTIVSVLIENLPLLITAAIEIIIALIGGLISAIPQLIAAIPEIIASIVDTFAEMDWGEIGKNILDGIGKGITNAVSGVVEGAKNAAASIAGAIGDFFGIASPSKLMTEYGGYISEGLADGIGAKKGLAQDALDGLLPPTLNPKVSAELMSSSEIGGTAKKTIEHTGVIRVEGVNSEGQLISAVEILISQMRRESMMAGTI